jgi:poly-gamma-glutamate capsule biosynthesis protein CapA/YwtB (metallophosphatase superfamily)
MKIYSAGLIIAVFIIGCSIPGKPQKNKMETIKNDTPRKGVIKLFICGDVMTGRGIDQALPHSVDPVLYESYVKDAGIYLKLAEKENGDIDVPVTYDYIWGDAIKIWEKHNPDLKLINLETSITTHEDPWPGKGINYRMHPQNVEVLAVAGIDYCSLANNHTLDWGRPGLAETMRTLNEAKIMFSGAGKNIHQAGKPSILNTGKSRVIVFSYGSPTSGIPRSWTAESYKSGVNFLPNLSDQEINQIKRDVELVNKSGDVVIFSVHWGGNWGYDIDPEYREFAHRLIDEAEVDIIYGHSSHHPLGIEVYNDKLIIYGAGDFINDYEGIKGHEGYRGELTLMYFPEIDTSTGQLTSLEMVPMEIKKFRLNNASAEDAEWLQKIMNLEGNKFGTQVRIDNDNSLWLEW